MTRVKFHTAADRELLALMPTQWGEWWYDASNRTLVLGHGQRYSVDLNDCTDTVAVLGWIAQVAGKSWADDVCLGSLVRALNAVLPLQAHYLRPTDHQTPEGQAQGMMQHFDHGRRGGVSEEPHAMRDHDTPPARPTRRAASGARWVLFEKRDPSAEGDRTIWVRADRVLAIVGGKVSGATLYLDGHDALIGVTATADQARALLAGP